ncbi:hypothetical protein BT69DRAFT_1117321 [Atractiella rhizophila]|nr:hypothetical protein BT69DRAFT_1117321 [Atractiella rhizophila]
MSTLSAPCRGSPWPIEEHLCDTFPLADQHSANPPPWTPHVCSECKLWCHSVRCTGWGTANSEGIFICQSCLELPSSRRFQTDVRRGQMSGEDVGNSTQDRKLAHSHWKGKAKHLKDTSNRWKAKENLRGTTMCALRNKSAQHEKLLQEIAKSNYYRIPELINRSLKRRDSVETILSNLHDAIHKVVRMSHQPPDIMDLAGLTLLLGGPTLLKAFKWTFGFPGETTVRTARKHTHLRPCAGYPTVLDINYNLHVLDINRHTRVAKKLNLPRLGFKIGVDEVKLEGQPQYDPTCNRIQGFCREHIGKRKLEVTSWEDVKVLADDRNKKLIHEACECSVFSFSPYSREGYSARPFVFSGTCKGKRSSDMEEDGDARKKEEALRKVENFEDEKNMLLLVIETVQQHLSEKGHELWTFASDGDALRRQAFKELFRKHHILDNQPSLREHLPRDLPAFNYECGDYGVVLTFDWKHLLKRIATLIRRNAGIRIGSAWITPSIIRDALLLHPDLTDRLANALFWPNDRQNVPKASRLIKKVGEFHSPIEFPFKEWSNPSRRSTVEGFRFLGTFLRLIYLPFADPSLSLFQQLGSLGTAAIVNAVLYRIHGGHWMSYLLFNDLQTMIKSVWISTVRAKSISPQYEFFILQDGTDCLEQLFGFIRTICRSDTNCDIIQLLQRAGHACELEDIFARHPAWKKTPARLNLKESEGIDHTNPVNWEGNVQVGHVDLWACWTVAIQAAKDLFDQYQSLNISSTAVTTFIQSGSDVLTDVDKAGKRKNTGNRDIRLSRAEVADEAELDDEDSAQNQEPEACSC